MSRRFYFSAAFLLGFLVLVFVISFSLNPHYPSQVIAGESSVATWVSGALLIMASAFALIIAMRDSWLPWLVASAFFILLAIDERFMIHEFLKEHLVFSFPDSSHFLHELPVLAGAFAGIVVSAVLWRHVDKFSRALLIGAAISGALSVTFDVLSAGVIWEEILKVLAEILLTLSLLKKISE